MSKHVLVIGGLREGHDRLKELGHRLSYLARFSYLTSRDHSTNGNNFELYHRVTGVPSLALPEEWVEHATAIHRIDPVDALACFSEATEMETVSISEALSLPFQPRDVVARTHNKHSMRTTLRAKGVDPTESRVVRTAEEIETFAATHGYPVILKPVDARGSSGVSKIRSAADIQEAIEWFEQGAAQAKMVVDQDFMLVEEELIGEEYSVEAFSEDGNHRVLCTTKKFKDEEHFVEVGHCLPAEMEPDVILSVNQKVSETLTALDLRYGPSHTEVIITREGPRVVETHARLGGDNIPLLIETVTGVDLVELWARQIMGEKVMHLLPSSFPDNSHAAIWYVSPRAVGTMERVEGIQEARQASGAAKVEVEQGPGSELAGTENSFSRAAYAVAQGSSSEEAVARARKAAEKLRFLVCCKG